MKISFLEKGVLALTAVLLMLIVGLFLLQRSGMESYGVENQTLWVSEVGSEGEQVSPEIQQVNLNAAGIDALQTLPGIGPVLAQAVVTDRQVYGRFRIPEDITRVLGIGQGTLEKIQNYIAVE